MRLTKLFTTLSLLIFSTAVFYALIKYTKNSPIKIHANDQFIINEIKSDLAQMNLNEKSFMAINPLKINKKLKENPLIKSVQSRRFLLPKPNISIYATEISPWLSYQRQLFSKDAEFITRVDSLNHSPKVSEYLQQLETEIMTVVSVNELNQKKLKLIIQISEIIASSLNKINVKDRIKEIQLDQDDNISVISEAYKFRIGPLSKEAIERAQRLETIFKKVQEIEAKTSKLEYIDLSLSGSEVILGKKD